MSRTVADAALMLGVIASGPDMRDRHTLPEPDFDWLACARPGDLKGLRIAYSPDWGYAAVDPEVRRVVGEAVAVFERDLGAHVEEAHPGWEDPFATFWALVALESDLTGMRRMAKGREHEISPHLLAFLQRPWTAEEFTDAVIARKAVCNKMWRFMQRYDLLLTPTLAVPPFPVHSQGPEIIDGRMVAEHAVARLHLPVQHDRPARGLDPGGLHEGRPAGRAPDRRPPPGRPAGAPGLGRLRGGASLGGRLAAAPRRAGPLGVPEAGRWSPETGSLDFRTLHAAYRDGSLTPEAVIEAVYARIDARGPDPAWTSARAARAGAGRGPAAAALGRLARQPPALRPAARREGQLRRRGLPDLRGLPRLRARRLLDLAHGPAPAGRGRGDGRQEQHGPVRDGAGRRADRLRHPALRVLGRPHLGRLDLGRRGRRSRPGSSAWRWAGTRRARAGSRRRSTTSSA